MELDFFFDFASSYSYVAASRVEALCQSANVRFRWRPFLLGAVFNAQEVSTPLFKSPVRLRYATRDLERLCLKHTLPFAMPSVFPQRSLQANRLACAALGEPWCGAFIRGTFRAQFARGLDIGQPETLAAVLTECGAEVDRWLDASTQPPAKQALKDHTDAALAAGVFGAPSCLVGTELFFGQDRLEEAIQWALTTSG